MEIVGKIIQILPLQEGLSKAGNPWKSQSFVIETQAQYPRKVCIELFGENNIQNNPCAVDDVVTISYDLESREYNGRWYTSVRAFRVVKNDSTLQATNGNTATATAATTAQAATAPAQTATNSTAPFDSVAGQDETEDLPF